MCKKDGCINRFHKAIAQLLAVFCKDAGFDTRLEVVIPEFVRTREGYQRPVGLSSREYTQMEQGILDVVASHPFDSTEFLLDATVRHPMASNSARLAPNIPGAAALHGEHDKHIRYPASRGRCVTPCAIETWGRICPSMYSFLESLSASAQRRDLAHSLPRGLYLQRWLTMLSCTLNKAISRAIFDSLYFSSPSPVISIDPTTVLTATQVTSALSTATGPYGLRLFPFPNTTSTQQTTPASAPPGPRATPATEGMRALFPELRTFATNADPHDLDDVEDAHHPDAVISDDGLTDHTAPTVVVHPGPVHSDAAAPLLAPAPNNDAAIHAEELLRSPPGEGLLNATLLDSCPLLVAAVAQVDQYS